VTEQSADDVAVTMDQMRALCAYEADVIEAHLSYATFPKTRRRYAEDQIKRLRALARGEYPVQAYGFSYLALRSSMARALNDGSACGDGSETANGS
jgi:hypothetical protein